MDYLPLFLQVSNQRCLVVGGGDIALRKIRLLKAPGANVRVVAREISADIREFLASGDHQLLEKPFDHHDLNDVCLVIAATDDEGVNRRVAELAQQQQLFVNVVDDADAGNAVMPAIVDRSPVVVAFSTGGKTPVLARLLRQKLETLLPRGYGRLAALAGECRDMVKARFSEINDRRYFWEKVLAGPAAEKALVGDLQGARNLIEQTLADTSEQKIGEVYLRVLRLKGGDPFIFGRGGEEIETLASEGIPFQVMPGITAASGCASYAGIPLTHRDHAQSVRFVTGHLQDGSYALNWQEMLDPGQTLVFYMGLLGLPRICQELIHHGRDAQTPIALIQQGTTRNQRVFTGTLATINTIIESEKVKAPTLIIVGSVVTLNETLSWYNNEKLLEQ